MKKDSVEISSRRDLIKAVGGTVVLLPVMGLAACSGGSDNAAPAAAKKPASAGDDAAAKSMAPKEAMPEPSPEPAAEAASTQATSPSGSQPRLSEDDPQAKSLAYVHDASTIDSAAQPRYQAGQACSNCALFQGKDGDEWGACSIFPGRQVKATGWCSVYAPKAG